MTLFPAVFLRILIGDIAQAILIKRIADRGSRSLTNLIAFSGAASIGLFVAFFKGSLVFDYTALIIITIGYFNALASRVHWEAVRINMTLASLYLVFDDVLAMALAYWVLNEGSFLTPAIA